MRVARTAVVLGVAAATAMGAAACGSSSSSGGSGGLGSGGLTAYNKGATGGSPGGTLRVVSEGDVGNFDSESVYDTNSNSLIRTHVRQLYANASSTDQSVRLPVQPDLAAALPTISPDGLTYTIKIKQGVDWNVDGTGRQVTAQDAIRGIKMTCNPVLPFGATYFQQNVAGMDAFCKGFDDVSQSDAGAIKGYEESTQVSGLQAVDDTTLKITLAQRTGDFIHFLALPAASPINVEQLTYVPDSPQFRQHTYSDGPYQITSYTPQKSIVLKRNPVWQASTDSLRKAYVDEIDISEGGNSATDLQQVQAGTADTTFGNDIIPTTAIPGLLSSGSTLIHLNPSGSTNPYIVFNTGYGNAAIKNVKVRQAIEYAVNKQAVSQVLGGPRIQPVVNQVFTSTVVGAGWQQHDMYPTPNNAGDPAKAKQLLSAAGYPNGVTLKFSYRTEGNGPSVATSLKTSLAAAGITLELKGVPNENYYGNYLQKTSIAQSGDWDLAEPGWSPDWEGNSERSYFSPLFDSRQYGPGSTNYGDYSNPAVNALADQALAETDQAKAAADWNKIDDMIMADAPWVPLTEQNQVNVVSARVKNYQYDYLASGTDLTNVAVQ